MIGHSPAIKILGILAIGFSAQLVIRSARSFFASNTPDEHPWAGVPDMTPEVCRLQRGIWLKEGRHASLHVFLGVDYDARPDEILAAFENVRFAKYASDMGVITACRDKLTSSNKNRKAHRPDPQAATQDDLPPSCVSSTYRAADARIKLPTDITYYLTNDGWRRRYEIFQRARLYTLDQAIKESESDALDIDARRSAQDKASNFSRVVHEDLKGLCGWAD